MDKDLNNLAFKNVNEMPLQIETANIPNNYLVVGVDTAYTTGGKKLHLITRLKEPRKYTRFHIELKSNDEDTYKVLNKDTLPYPTQILGKDMEEFYNNLRKWYHFMEQDSERAFLNILGNRRVHFIVTSLDDLPFVTNKYFCQITSYTLLDFIDYERYWKDISTKRIEISSTTRNNIAQALSSIANKLEQVFVTYPMVKETEEWVKFVNNIYDKLEN